MSRARWMGMVVAGAGLAAGLTVLPAEGRVSDDVQVIESYASGAAIGLISRFPAESPGGLMYTATAITLDKATARAAGVTAGELTEGFFASSLKQYRNPTMITAQYPATAAFPAEARGGTDTGVATLHAAATDGPSATAEAEGGRAGDGANVAVHHATSLSHSEFTPDGVATRVVATASGISIGDVVTIASATTETVTIVPSRGLPTSEVKVTLTGLLVGGVPAELTDQGVRISDRIPIGPGELAAFNAATAQLAERGLTVTATRVVRETSAKQARAEGGAVIVRYKVADQLGGDEEVIIAQAQSRSTLLLTEAQPSLPPVPELPGSPVPPAEVESAPAAAQAGDASSPSAPALDTLGGSFPLATSDAGPPAANESAALGTGGGGPSGSGASSDSALAGTASDGGFLNFVDQPIDPAVGRLRSGYQFILLLAAAGAAGHLVIVRTRSR